MSKELKGLKVPQVILDQRVTKELKDQLVHQRDNVMKLWYVVQMTKWRLVCVRQTV